MTTWQAYSNFWLKLFVWILHPHCPTWMIGKEARFSTEFSFWSDNFPFRSLSASWVVLISLASISSRANSLTGQLKGMSLCKYTNHMLIVTDIWNIYLKHLFCRTYRLDKCAKSVSCLTSSCTVFNKFFEILEVSVWKNGLFVRLLWQSLSSDFGALC